LANKKAGLLMAIHLFNAQCIMKKKALRRLRGSKDKQTERVGVQRYGSRSVCAVSQNGLRSKLSGKYCKMVGKAQVLKFILTFCCPCAT
jgi:hypothetical protein